MYVYSLKKTKRKFYLSTIQNKSLSIWTNLYIVVRNENKMFVHRNVHLWACISIFRAHFDVFNYIPTLEFICFGVLIVIRTLLLCFILFFTFNFNKRIILILLNRMVFNENIRWKNLSNRWKFQTSRPLKKNC